MFMVGRRLIASFAAGGLCAAIACGVVAGLAPDAAAELPYSCTDKTPAKPTGDYETIGGIEKSGGPWSAYGNIADIYIPTNGAQCQRINSIYLINQDYVGLVEFGFFKICHLDVVTGADGYIRS